MPPEETVKIECIKGCCTFAHEKTIFAEDRSSQLADEFTRIEIQIAAILFAFSSIFINLFSSVNIDAFPPIGAIFIKLSFAIALFFLLASLVCGLIHIKMKEGFWNRHIKSRHGIFLKYQDALKNKNSFEDACAYHLGVAGGEMGTVRKSSVYTWLIQTIFLITALLILFILTLVFLFS